MKKETMVCTDFWNDSEGVMMTLQDKYFYLYLLTNKKTNHIGIYQITKKQMAFDLGYSIETVDLLLERFSEHHKLIRYNSEWRELGIKNWGKHNLYKVSKPLLNCILSELKDVCDPSLIPYVSESIQQQEIRSLYETFFEQD
jgi:hypothetical protein